VVCCGKDIDDGWWATYCSCAKTTAGLSIRMPLCLLGLCWRNNTTAMYRPDARLFLRVAGRLGWRREAGSGLGSKFASRGALPLSGMKANSGETGTEAQTASPFCKPTRMQWQFCWRLDEKKTTSSVRPGSKKFSDGSMEAILQQQADGGSILTVTYLSSSNRALAGSNCQSIRSTPLGDRLTALLFSTYAPRTAVAPQLPRAKLPKLTRKRVMIGQEALACVNSLMPRSHEGVILTPTLGVPAVSHFSDDLLSRCLPGPLLARRARQLRRHLLDCRLLAR
jgi:hypothetical protein